jgi:hypothetical protein
MSPLYTNTLVFRDPRLNFVSALRSGRQVERQRHLFGIEAAHLREVAFKPRQLLTVSLESLSRVFDDLCAFLVELSKNFSDT